MSFKDYYQVLGVYKDATQIDIRTAFRRLAFLFHPDRNPDDQEQAEVKFKEINEAYEVLGDESRRLRYDYLMSRVDQGLSVNFDVIRIKQSYGCRRGYGCRRHHFPIWKRAGDSEPHP